MSNSSTTPNFKDIRIEFRPKGIIADENDDIDISGFIENTFEWFRKTYKKKLRSVVNNFDYYVFERDETDLFKFILTLYRTNMSIVNVNPRFIKRHILDIDKEGEYPHEFGYNRISYDGELYDTIYFLGDKNSVNITYTNSNSTLFV